MFPCKLVCYALSLVLMYSGSSTVQGQLIHDANADFVPNVSNPNGVWSYGYTTVLGGSFVQHLEYATSSNGFAWLTNQSLGAPSFGKITNFAQNGIQPGQTFLHGGPGGEFAVLRFTAQTSNIYNLFAEYFTGDSGNTDAHILLNSNVVSQLFQTPSTTGGGTFSQNGLSLASGDTVDFSLGTGGDGFSFDSTPMNMIFSTSAVPEPGVCLLFAIAASTVLSPRRRRK